MFIDGLIYSTIAHNLSEGIGTFWAPVLKNSEFLFFKGEIFYDHPPMVFGIESVFFRLFGEHGEWIYNIVIVLLLLYAVLLLFRAFCTQKKDALKYGFIPILFLFLMPEFVQKATYNLLDSTLAVFTCLSVYFILLALQHQKQVWRNLILGAVFLVFAVLSKGPVGLFPLATPFLYYLIMPGNAKLKSTLFSTGVVFLVTLLAGAIIYVYEPSRLFIEKYTQQQVVASVLGDREKTSSLFNHLSLLYKLFLQLLPTFVLIAVAAIVRWRKKLSIAKENQKAAIFFLLIALSASLPIALSAKHHSFYLIPSFAFFSLAATFYVKDLITLSYLNSLRRWNFAGSAVWIIVTITIFLYSFIRPEKYYFSHRQFLKEMEVFAPAIPRQSTICVSDSLLTLRGDISCNLERYFQFDLTSDTSACQYILSYRSAAISNDQLIAETTNFKVFKK